MVKTTGAGNNPVLRLQADTNKWDLQGTFSNTNDELFFMYNSSTKLAINKNGRIIKNNKKVAIVFEGRDSAGKGSTIKRFIEYLNPRGFKVVALGLPTDEEKKNWFGIK